MNGPLALLALLAAGPAHALQHTLTDPQGFVWDVEYDGHGGIYDGTDDAYDEWPHLCVTTDLSLTGPCPVECIYRSNLTSVVLDTADRQVVMPAVEIAGLLVQRKVFVPASGALGYARFQEILENTGTADVTVKVRVGTSGLVGGLNDLGSDYDTVVVATSDGTGVLGPGLQWFVTDDNGGTDPFLGHVPAGAAATVEVAALGILETNLDDIVWEYTPITLSPGERVVLLHFQTQQADATAAQSAASLLAELYTHPGQTDGMTPEDLTDVANFAPHDLDGDHVYSDIDNCPNDANPGQEDADGDGAGDACDTCPGFDDGEDEDWDGVPDACDACPTDPLDDPDADTVCNSSDNCPDDANPGQEDDDGDDAGDACDRCPGFDDTVDGDSDGLPDGCDPCPHDSPDDTDGDGVCDTDDVCPSFDDTQDGDEDGYPDGCDPCPADPENDRDGDGACDSDDPCPDDPHDDSDGDGSCDSEDPCPSGHDGTDEDGDGIADWCDQCAAGDDTVDGDGDGIPDACDPCPSDADRTCAAIADDVPGRLVPRGCACDAHPVPATADALPFALWIAAWRRRSRADRAISPRART